MLSKEKSLIASRMAQKDDGIAAAESEIAAVQMDTQDLQLAFNAFNAIYQVTTSDHSEITSHVRNHQYSLTCLPVLFLGIWYDYSGRFFDCRFCLDTYRRNGHVKCA